MQTQPEQPPSTKATRREWIALAVLALPCMLVVMDLTVLFLAVPQLSADLDPSSTQLLWITDIYGFLIAGTLITMGTLGDRIGRRKLLLTGAGVFGAASVLAAMSNSAEMLIVARGIQGLAGATLVPSVLALTYTMFTDEIERTRAMGIIMGGFAAGAALGPVLGGVVLEFADWHAVFLLNVPVMLVLLAIGRRLLPEHKAPQAGRIDLVSTALSITGILAFVYGVKEIARHGGETVPVASVALGIAIAIVFVRRQRRLEHPLLDVSLFKIREFSTALGSNVLGALVMYGIFLFISQYLQVGLGMSPLEAGLWGLPGIAGLMVTSALVPEMTKRARPAYVVAAGMLLTSIGFAMLTQMTAEDGIAYIVIANVIMSIGIAPGTTLGTGLIIGAAPPERTGSASAVAETGNELGGAFGIALLGSIGTAIYRSDVSDAVPSTASSSAADATRESLAGAASVADQLPTGVLDAAKAGFVDAMSVVATISSVAMLIAAVVFAVVLRHVRSPGQAAEVAAEPAHESKRPKIGAPTPEAA